MPDIRWIKLATSTPDDEKIRLIDAMPERDTVHYLWMRLLIQAGKTNADGEIFLSEDIPYTDKMLAILFSRPLTSIRLALRTFSRLGMIEIDSNHVIRIVNWDKHQSVEGMERVRALNRKRVENHREKKKQDEKAAKDSKEELEGIENVEGTDIKNDFENDLNSNTEKITGGLESEVSDNINEGEVNDVAIIDTNEQRNKVTSDSDINKCNATRDYSNVTHNKSNVTVTEQNKKEIENKKKRKKEKKEIENKNNNSCDVNIKSSICDEDIGKPSLFRDKNTKSESPGEEDIDTKALELMHYHEKRTGVVGGKNYSDLREAVDIHGEKWVRTAMDIAFKKNCPDIEYAFGVLKNWRRDGYPNDDMEVKRNGFRGTGKNNSEDKNEFAGFKPKEPRRLTEAERKRAEANLI